MITLMNNSNNNNTKNLENKATAARPTGTKPSAVGNTGTKRNVANAKSGVTKKPQTNKKKVASGTKSTGSNSKKKKVYVDEIVRKGFKRTSGFMFRLMVNLIIIFIVVSIFSYAFNFAYSVFGDVAKDPDSNKYVIVEIPTDSSVIKIGEALEDADIIDNKYVFYVKVKLKDYAGKITPGRYGLSASMNFEEIMQIICDFSDPNAEVKGE